MSISSAGIEIFIYVSKTDPKTPWIVKYEDPNSETGFNEKRFSELQILVPVRTAALDQPENFGKYALKCRGRIEEHPLEPRAIIHSPGMPTRWT